MVRWRATILFSILISGFILGSAAFAGAMTAIAKEGVWGMAVSNSIGLVICFLLLRISKIKFEIRAAITCFIFFFIGMVVIISIGPQLGGPAWLFTFSVLSGVLLGGTAACAAILLNALFLITISLLMLNGTLDYNIPFLSSPKDMVASIGNFLVTNTIAAISVTAIVKGVFGLYNERKKLNRKLEKEQTDLLLVKKSLEEEIRERILAEEEKIEAQRTAGEQEKYALVGQIAGKMAHDFNNVLGIVMGHSELALLTCNDPKMKSTFDLILNQTLRGRNLTKNLIAFAKSSVPKQTIFSIGEKVDFVLNLLKTDLDGIDILKDNWESVEVMADPGMIEHSIVNLIQNSIHATSLTERPKIIIRIYCIDQEVRLEVEDNGCGIPEEYIDNIYDPSFTLKGSQDVLGRYKSGIKGTGYGMANIKKYVELHNGRILTESILNSGTKVIVTLPWAGKKRTTQEELQAAEVKNFSNRNILIVEDEPAISHVQHRVLSQAPNNHKVDVASNGQTAIEMINNNQYDLISLDYMLPGKINGIDVYHHIRETNSSIPILFVSGNIEFLESINMLAQKDPMISNISKPCRNIDYLNRISKLFALSS